MEKKDRYISIGEMAKINRTTVPTLRLYDSMGLLTPYYTDEETHYRYYDIKQNARFDMIQYMKELGMELKEIKEQAKEEIDKLDKATTFIYAILIFMNTFYCPDAGIKI